MNEITNNEQVKEDLCEIIPFDLEEAETIIKRIEEFNPKDNLRKIEAEYGSKEMMGWTAGVYRYLFEEK